MLTATPSGPYLRLSLIPLDAHRALMAEKSRLHSSVCFEPTHTILLDDCGIAACDLVVIGNLSLGIGMFEHKGRSACVRFKSSEATGEFCRAADAAIDAFVKPLAVATRLAQAARSVAA